MRFLTAPTLFTGTTCIYDKIIAVSEDGRIADLISPEHVDPLMVERFDGMLLPGFVNAHCHLELSHLRNVFPQKTGLPEFLRRVIAYRGETSREEIQEAMERAEEEMYANGIVAVGDISNLAHSFSIKANKKLFYHTFVELISFHPASAEKVFADGLQLLEEAKQYALSASPAPHATYSVSPELLRSINTYCREYGMPTSIHMLESNDENELWVQGTGAYRSMLREMGVDLKFFEPTGKTALESLLPYFDPAVKTLLVHNTIATAADVHSAEEKDQNLFWCFCPNANLFIEDRLPDIPSIAPEMKNIVVGTDSLSSNTQLSILAELQTIQKQYPEIKTETLLQWATKNGAEFLGIGDMYGSLEKGKSPGIVHLKTSASALDLKDATASRVF
ncbi:MAG: amidohydrolase family protein [Chitinophagales bacterium]